MRQASDEKDGDIVCSVFSELKSLGVKVPKIKKFKSGITKQVRAVSSTNGRIFGVYLREQEKISVADYVLPKFIFTSTSYLKKYTKIEIGLFRKAGSVSRQRNLRSKLERGESIEESEPNDVASLLKQWLRELPEPLIPVYLWDLFIRCQSLQVAENRTAAILSCCHLLPVEHLHTLKYLLEFLSDIATNSDKNKMGAHNLALIMTPNIFVMGAESIDKSSGNLVQLHTSVVELLINNVQRINVTPQCSSSHLAESEALKYGTDLDLSTDALDYSPSKSKKKRRSGPVQDLFTGFRKLVGQNSTPPNPSKRCSQNDDKSALLSASRSASKRKAGPEQLSLSPLKKQATATSNVLQNGNLNFTPNSKSSQSIFGTMKEKTGSGHSRRKSFGLLRRKDKKRQKASKSNELVDNKVETKVDISTPSPFVEKLVACLQEPEEAKEACLSKSSPLLSPSDIDRILKSTFSKKSISDCYLTVQAENYQNRPIFSTSSSEGCLYHQESKRPLKRKSDVLNRASKVDKENVRQSSSPRLYKKASPLANRTSPKLETLNSKDVVITGDTKSNFSEDNSSLIIKDYNQTDALNASQVLNRRVSSRKKNNYNLIDSSTSLISKTEKPVSDKCPNSSDIEISSSKGVVITGDTKSNFSEDNSSLTTKDYDQIDALNASQVLNRRVSSRRKKNYNLKDSCTSLVSKTEMPVGDKCPSSNDIKDVKDTTSNYTVTKARNELSVENEDKIKRQCSLKRQEAFVIRSKSNKKMNSGQIRKADSIKIANSRSKNSHVNLQNENSNSHDTNSADKEKQNALTTNTSEKRRIKRNVRNGSIVRGRPNTVKTGLPSDLCSRYNNELISSNTGCQLLTSTSSVDNDLFINVVNDSEKKDNDMSITLQIQNTTLSTPQEENSLKNINAKRASQTSSFQATVSLNMKETKIVSKKKNREIIYSNSDSKIHKMKTRSSKVARINSFPEQTARRRPKIKKLTEINSPSPRKSVDKDNKIITIEVDKENVFVPESPPNTASDNIFKTPNVNFQTPEVWFSGREYLETEKPRDDDIHNKRESIALILKNKQGHVQQKVSMYDHRSRSSSTDTPSVFRNVRMSQKSSTSVRSNKSGKTRYSPLPPPPKFIIPDSPPKPSYPLKELTNISNAEDTVFSPSPAKASFSTPNKDKNSAEKRNRKCTLQPKRNSYSGHTPYKLPKEKNKVVRSESSPLLQKTANKSLQKLQESPMQSPLSTIRDHNSPSSSNKNCFSTPVFKTKSYLSIEKLRPDQLTDEWHCEM